MASPAESLADITKAQKALDEAAARKMAKKAERQAYWDEYNKQLEKATPHQGGAKHSNRRRGRVFRWK